MGKDIPETQDLSELDGTQKAAILLLSLDQDSAGLILRGLDAEAVEEVTRELATMGSVPPAVRDAVITEFYQLAMAQSWAAEGGLEYAIALIRKSCDPDLADKLIQVARPPPRPPGQLVFTSMVSGSRQRSG